MLKTFYVGPPGTGKTESLIRKTEEILKKGIQATEIAYISFTTVAAKEARNRAIDNFPDIPERQFRHFQTLHSLCYDNVPDLRDNTMTSSDYAAMGKLIPVNWMDFKKGIVWEAPTDMEGRLTTANPYLRTSHTAAVKKIPVMEYFEEVRDHRIKRSILEKLDEEFTRYKKENYLYDFNDYLVEFCKLPSSLTPKFKILIVDECQDLSPLQWDCIKKMMAESELEEIYFAGDDDQAIYEWAGADVNQFRSLADTCDKVIHLEASHRVPASAHALAEAVIANDTGRIQKKYLPAPIPGGVEYHVPSIDHTISDIKSRMERGWTTLILASFKKPLKDAERALRSAGLRFESASTSGLNETLVELINIWERWRKGNHKIAGTQVKQMYKYLATGTGVARGFKTGAKSPDDLEDYTVEDCIEKYGLLVRGPWYEAFEKIKDSEKQYMRQIENSGRKLTDPPMIRVSTISSIKGAEADNVIVYTDIPYPEVLQMQKGNNEVHRKFYVAVTRTKRKLTILLPQRYSNAYPLNRLAADIEELELSKITAPEPIEVREERL